MRKIVTLLVAAAAIPGVSAIPGIASPQVAATLSAKTVVAAAGGRVPIRATVSGASGWCTWSVHPRIEREFEARVRCQAKMDRVAILPANKSDATESYVVQLQQATKPKATAQIVLKVAGKAHRGRKTGTGPTSTAPTSTAPSSTVPSTTVPPTTLPSTTVPNSTVPTSTVPTTTLPSTTVPTIDHICGVAGTLDGPSTAPGGAVTVPAGNDSSVVGSLATNATYWFAPGTHTLGTGQYDQIDPSQGDTFIGAPGAVLSGQWDNNSAFGGTAPDVTIEYLTIQNFDPPGAEGAVNHDSGEGWTIEHDTLQDNSPGAALMVGTNNVVTSNCLTDNGEYGFNAYSANDVSSLTGGPSNVTVTNNEISYNNTCNWEDESPSPVPAADVPSNCTGTSAGQFDGCGCSGGGKFWEVDGASVTNNYVHNNYDVGLWADTDNAGFDVSGNTFASNWSVGYQEEISYNFSITDNAFIDNAWGDGPTNGGFPTGAIYVSESGGDSRVPGAYSGVALISDNTFTDNWSGVVLWENSNRFCSDGSDGACTLVDPAVFTQASCAANLPTATSAGNPDYFDGCRWKTQNVEVTDNTFDFTQSNVPGCQLSANNCGQNALFSEYGSSPPFEAWVVPENTSNNQHNAFSDNTYSGPWSFVGFNQGDSVTWTQWTAGFADQNGSNDQFTGQDAGSTYNNSPPAI